MCFGEKWIGWIQFCISNVGFSLIINGKPEGFFQLHRGLRQGDPMSHFFFLLTIKGQNHMFRITKVYCWIKGFSAQLGER